MVADLKSLKDRLAVETQGYSAEQLIKRSLEVFGDKITLATSFGAEDQVLTDMLCRVTKNFDIFTLDTGRLPEETYEAMEATRQRYGIKIEVLSPEQQKVEEMVNKYGQDLFCESIETRKLCCRIRKIEPLQKKLRGFQAWFCGLRAEQSVTRAELKKVEWDAAFDLIKINPLSDWSTQSVWDYIRKNDVPYNKLHDKGYPSIGCASCTRAIKDGEDIRAGRWWWESPEQKECGLHLVSRDDRKKEK